MIFLQIAWLFIYIEKDIESQFSIEAIMDEFEFLKGRRV